MSKQPNTITPSNLPRLPARALDIHKGQLGHLLVIGGDYTTGGAPLMAAEMALRSGAGLVSLATRPEHAGPILARTPEIMCLGISSANQLHPVLSKATVISVGMGLGQNNWGLSLLSALVNLEIPQVWDADALNLLARGLVNPPQHAILTPHVGEAARLLNCSTQCIQKDRTAAILNLVNRYQTIVVLKGAGTLIASPSGQIMQCNQGHPAMAGAGLGDVLSGLIGSLIAQHLPPFEAAILAVWLHAKAGEILGKQFGRGLLATDLLPIIRQLLEEHSPCLA